MPEYLAPGVYVEEVSSGIKPIEGVSTSTAGFLGRTERGPAGAHFVTSFTEFQRLYGGFMSGKMYLPNTVKGFFDNGGKRAFISRVSKADAKQAAETVQGFTFTANGYGRWGNNVFVLISPATRQPQGPGQHYRVTAVYYRKRPAVWVNPLASLERIMKEGLRLTRPDFMEDFDNLAGPRDVENVINARSVLITVKAPGGRVPSLSNIDPSAATQRWTRLKSDSPSSDSEAIDVIKADRALARTGKLAQVASSMRKIAGKLEATTDTAAAKALTEDLKNAAADVKKQSDKFAPDPNPFTVASEKAAAEAQKVSDKNGELQDLADDKLEDARNKAKEIADAGKEAAAQSSAFAEFPNAVIEKMADRAAEVLEAVNELNDKAPMLGKVADIKIAGGAANEAVSAFAVEVKNLADALVAADSGVTSVSIEARKAAGEITDAAEKISKLEDGDSFEAKTRPLILDITNSADKAFAGATDAEVKARGVAAATLVKYDEAEVKADTNDQPSDSADFVGNEDKKTGLIALEAVDEISIVVAPEHVDVQNLDQELNQSCLRLADRVVLLSVTEDQQDGLVQDIRPGNPSGSIDSTFAAFYHPWIDVSDPTPTSVPAQPVSIPAIGHIAGILARTDITRGVHKAPANEVVLGAVDLSAPVNKGQQDILNPRGVNCIRDFRADGRGIRLWGARTTSSDPEWKYLNVRRLFLFLEESIDQGTQWVVFEPNSDPTWAAVRRSISNFLLSVWRSGALLGAKPEDAFFVRCDRTTMTEDDLLNGRLVCVVGVAPVRPAEFVIIRISQMTAEAQS